MKTRLAALSLAASAALAPAATAQLLAPTPAPAAAFDARALAESLFDRLQAGDYAALEARYTEQMKMALPAGSLSQTWKSVGQQLGAFRSRGTPTVSRSASSTIVDVPAVYEKGEIGVRFVFDGESRLSGLRVLPGAAAKPPAPWEPPAYVRAGAFTSRDVTAGAAGWPLPATVTMPAGKGPFPGVVLVHGSGPQDRDESIGGVKPFRDLAEGLASRGIAVLRYEKRTKALAARMLSDPRGATLDAEVIDDAVAGAELLRKTPGVDPARVFVLGHSLGAMLVPRISARLPNGAGFVALAAAARPLDKVILAQTTYMLKRSGLEGKALAEKLAPVEAELSELRKAAAEGKPTGLVMGAPGSYWKEMLAVDPAREIVTVRAPLLLLQGERDYQVTMEDFAALKAAIAPLPKASAKSYPRLNHLFVAGVAPSTPEEYEKPGHVDPAVVDDVAAFLLGKAPGR